MLELYFSELLCYFAGKVGRSFDALDEVAVAVDDVEERQRSDVVVGEYFGSVGRSVPYGCPRQVASGLSPAYFVVVECELVYLEAFVVVFGVEGVEHGVDCRRSLEVVLREVYYDNFALRQLLE